MEAAASTREDAPLEDTSAGVSTTSATITVQRDAAWGVPLLLFGSVLAIYAGIGYAVYLMVAAIA
jgi:hypothetical protein